MIIQVTCPCGCGHTFDVEVKRTNNVSDEVRAARAEHARGLSHPGRPKGVKESKPRKTRSDKGKPRMSAQAKAFMESAPGVVDVGADVSKVGEFIAKVRNFESDPKACPLAQANGGPCDGVLIGDDGTLAECNSMMECYFKHQRYKIYKK